jgi:hypothetical protein
MLVDVDLGLHNTLVEIRFGVRVHRPIIRHRFVKQKRPAEGGALVYT